jgi:Zn-dependent protease with chaperone function
MAQLIRLGAVLLAALVWLLVASLLWRTAVPANLRLPPVDVDAVFGARAVERAADYRRVLRLLWLGLTAAQLTALWLLVRAAPRIEARLRGRSLLSGIQLGLMSVALLWVVWLPFGMASLWWRRRHDISRLGYADLLVDPWPTYLGEALVTAGAVAVAMVLARRLGRRWWLVGGPAFVVLVAGALVLTPLVLTPRLAPLQDRQLAAEIQRMARREGVGKVRVEVENASRRTTVPNAEAIGVGPTTRVVLWDTLLDGRFTKREIRFISAHELGHVGHDHLWKGIGWFALFALPSAWLLAYLTDRRGGLDRPSVVPFAVFVVVVIQLALQPLANVVSRRYEAEADWTALRTTRDPQAAESLFRKFSTTSLDQPDPPDWVYLLLSTHPSLADRVAMAEDWQARASRGEEAPRAGS